LPKRWSLSCVNKGASSLLKTWTVLMFKENNCLCPQTSI
jgi:hypothetical protein